MDTIKYNVLVPNIVTTNKLISLGCNNIAASVLSTRIPENLTDDEYKAWLNNSIDNLPKIEDNLPNLDKAVNCFKQFTPDKNPHILIVSDFDCDGITSAVMAYKSLTTIFKIPNLKVTTLVNRRRDGTGYNRTLISRIKKVHLETPVDLLISFDHGSQDEAAYKELKETLTTTEFIITDHHLPDINNLPVSSNAFVNPHISGSTNEILNVSGCCVGFLTLFYIYRSLYNKSYKEAITDFKPVLSYVGLSTISDVMPLNNRYNRYFAKLGLKVINTFRESVWRELRTYLNVDIGYDFRTLSHKVAPLVNTGNRTATEQFVYDYLTFEDRDKRDQVINVVLEASDRRKVEADKVIRDITSKLTTVDSSQGLCVVMESELAIGGIIAVRIGELYKTPCICFTLSDRSEVLAGSIRGCVEGFDVVEIFKSIQQDDPTAIGKFGGHTGAGGCSVPKDKLDRFKELFHKHTSKMLSELKDKQITIVDLELDNSRINQVLYEQLSILEPYGKDWRRPLIKSKFRIQMIKFNPKRLELILLTKDNRKLKAYYSYQNDRDDLMNFLKEGQQISLLFTVEHLGYLPGALILNVNAILRES